MLPTLHTMFLFWACVCSFSRIVDHRHHWWDVLVGASLGVGFGILTVTEMLFFLGPDLIYYNLQCLYLCKDFKSKSIVFAQDPIIHQNGNGDRHTSVRRLLSDSKDGKDDVTLSHVIVP